MSIYKTLFSHRKGLTKQSVIMHRNVIPTDVVNAITSAYYLLCQELDMYTRNVGYHQYCQKDIEKNVWWQFFNQPLEDFAQGSSYRVLFRSAMEDASIVWYRKLDLLEFVIRSSVKYAKDSLNSRILQNIDNFVSLLNEEFERLDFGYRIVDNRVTDITSDEEIDCIKKSLAESKDNVRCHLSKALELYSSKPDPDIRNSIKESISAVEAVCRDLTGEDTLGKALNKLESRGMTIQTQLKSSIEKMYAYTNQPDTGIRHALMESEGACMPTKSEAYFMLISCSAFINYLRMKTAR